MPQGRALKGDSAGIREALAQAGHDARGHDRGKAGLKGSITTRGRRSPPIAFSTSNNDERHDLFRYYPG
jgi:hypothetical protein